MRRVLVMIVGVALVACGCRQGIRESAMYTKSGQPKPVVVVLPVLDSTDELPPVGWSVSRELTQELRERVGRSPKVYLLKEGGSLEMAAGLNALNPHAIPRVTGLGAAEFVVVTELLDHRQEGAHKRRSLLEEGGPRIAIDMRLRVLDVRGREPKVILQEVVHHTQAVAQLEADYAKAQWGSEAYERTPLGVAHAKLVREIVSRVEGYVGAHKA